MIMLLILEGDMLKIVGICGGSRNRAEPEILLETIKSTESFEDLLQSMKKMRISNSEVGVMAGLFGVFKEGVDIQLFRLNKLFSSYRQTDTIMSMKIKQTLLNSQGICITTPVHFGNPSAYVAAFLDFMCQKFNDNYPLLEKIVGYNSVGARWNGGTVGANIFGLFECLQMGAIIVGDGPPGSQCGGCIQARHITDAIKDMRGIRTCINTGSRIAKVSKLYNNNGTNKKVHIVCLNVTTKENNQIKTLIQKEISDFSGVSLDIINIDQLVLEQTKGCLNCPAHLDDDYGCITNDDMKKVHQIMLRMDGIILMAETITYSDLRNFRAFIERTRYLRRRNYILSNIPVGSIYHMQKAEDVAFQMRLIPSLLKHNMILVGPFTTINRFFRNKSRVLDEVQSYLRYFIDCVKRIKMGRSRYQFEDQFAE